MLLAIDIGNTNINYGLFEKGELLKKGKFLTYPQKYEKYLKNLCEKKIEDVIISSVVPSSLKRLKRNLQKKFSSSILVLGENISVPIKNLYKKPKQVGQDRLVNAYAGYYFYGGNLMIVDFGTAVTFDVVSEKGEYLGGMIFPGLKTSLDALCLKAALLPKKMTFRVPRNLIGVSTEESILSGIFNGFLAMTRELFQMFKETQGIKQAVFTGGDAHKLYPYLSDLGPFRETLTLEGLSLLYENDRKTNKNLFRCD